ncbi:hypothetical protein Dimus_026569 [Dionaea muscipula]
MEATRIRLLFDGGHILSKSQRRQGLKRSWLLLEPQLHTTISDLVSHLLCTFHLHDSCPNGLIVSMDGFVLPPFESTTILKDKDLIRVNQRGDKMSKTINVTEEARTSEEEDLFDKLPLVPGMKLLANEEFEKETGGYQSEPQEDGDEEENDVLLVNSTPNMDSISRKRKSSKNFESSKKKRPRQIADRSVENSVKDKHIECCQHVDGAHKKRKSSMRNSKLVHEDGKGTSTPSDIADENKKSSRSSRRKKAKRLWLREIKKAEKEKIDFHSLVNVRIMKRENFSPSEVGPPAVVKQAPVSNGQPSTSGLSSRGFETPVRSSILPASGTQPITIKKEMIFRAPGKGDVDPWEELTQALDAKKTDLLQPDDRWNQNGNSEKRTWSYRTVQRSALGPTLNRLREQNRI